MTILLLDLDGTLTNTAHSIFKGIKDGKTIMLLQNLKLKKIL